MRIEKGLEPKEDASYETITALNFLRYHNVAKYWLESL